MENQVVHDLPEGQYLRSKKKSSDEVSANVTQLMLELQQEVDELFASVKAQENASQELEGHLIELNDKLTLTSKTVKS
jgi:5,10-methylene-tetrahydrofolate dehydrogenase/methenyl tetrahydrofolate cyclohydrolase